MMAKEKISSNVFEAEYFKKPSSEELAKRDKAFRALLAYEINCQNKYDRPRKPSLPPKPGETMVDFANRFDTTIEEMKEQWIAVEIHLNQSKD